METVLWRLAAAAWAIEIFAASTDGISSNVTQSYLAVVLGFLHIHLSPEPFDLLHTVTRKSAHILEYTAFTFLLYRAAAPRARAFQTYAASFAGVGACLYSLSDEFHQTFVASRGASLWDCCLDATGAMLAIGILHAFSRRRREVLANA